MSSIVKKTVAVLGCGPAGLLAAHAVALTGHPLAIFSIPAKSQLGGAQFLHSAIPELTGPTPDAVVNTIVQGDATTYQQKAYGVGAQPDFVSFNKTWHGRTQQAWSMVEAYDELWDRFGQSITEVNVTHEWLRDNVDNFRMVVSTIPRIAVCGRTNPLDSDPWAPHRFTRQQINILPNMANDPTTGRPLGDKFICYNGANEPSWYRSSHLFGHKYTEFGAHVRTPMPGLRPASKPLATACDCFNGQVVFAGRWGQWRKGVLIDDAFRTVVRAMHERGLINLGPPEVEDYDMTERPG